MDTAAEFRRLSTLLDQGLTELREQGMAAALAENTYRKFVAETWLNAPPGDVRKGGMSADERLAWVQGQTADARLERDVAVALVTAAHEAVRSRRAQISYHQSLLKADTAELEMARTGPRYEP